MAIFSGKDGIVKIGTDAVGELKSFGIDENADTIETSNMTSSYKTFVAGKTSWSGTFECHYSDTDAGQAAITVGSIVSLSMYIDATNGKTGDAHVDSIGVSTGDDEVTKVSYSFTGTGALADI